MVRSLVFISAIAEAADDIGMLQATKLAEEQSNMLKTDSAGHLEAVNKSLSALSRVQDPRRASQLLQEFAMNAVEAGQGIDDDTKRQLIAIRDILTQETYVQLEQAHRHDQDLLIKHANAINDCGQKHIRHLQQDVEGQEVQLVRDIEEAMYDCRGVGVPCPHLDQVGQHAAVGLLQTPTFVTNIAAVAECELCEIRDGCRPGWEHCAADEWGNYDPAADESGYFATLAIHAHPNDVQIQQGVLRWQQSQAGTQCEPCEIRDGCRPRWEDCAADQWGNYDPAADESGYFALQAVRSHPNDAQILKGVWRSATGYTTGGHRMWADWSGVNDPRYQAPDWRETGSCAAANCAMFTACDALHDFIDSLPRPNCEPPIGDTVMEVPTCDGDGIRGVDSDLEDWFTNMATNARFFQEHWRELKAACDTAREYFTTICAECSTKQHLFEQAFCSYRQGLHATCREYQGCHVLNEEQFNDLVREAMYNADSRKIDWKAIHKIECYINVLISNASNTFRARDLLNCEAGNLNTIETILTGFNETNYLSLFRPDINQSCWDLDVPSYIDFKECDMTSIQQHPCTDRWMQRYDGQHCVAECTSCAPIPDEFQYHATQSHGHRDHQGHIDQRFGGGWHFVNEVGRSNENIDDLTPLAPGGYHLPKYVTTGLRWNEVMVERVSPNWCDSFGRQSDYWVEEGGASMCVQSDDEYVYCMNNGDDAEGVAQHTFRQQPVSHFRKLCNNGTEAVEGRPGCDCWPSTARRCWSLSNPVPENKPAPRGVRILSMGTNGSVVKISYQGQEKVGATLRVAHMAAFIGEGEGCRAISDVKYRVYVRCLGCTTEEREFHTVPGIELTPGTWSLGRPDATTHTEYTYEAWFKSPLRGAANREIFGGSDGLMLVNTNAVPCLREVGNHGQQTHGYQVHVGGTDKYGSICFAPMTWYHVAVTRDLNGTVTVYVNNQDVTATGTQDEDRGSSTLGATVGGGFQDGGQLFNIRVWNHARTHQQLINDAFASRVDTVSDIAGLEHWYPLTENIQDLMTGFPLTGGGSVRSSPIWCSDLEAGGMTGC